MTFARLIVPAGLAPWRQKTRTRAAFPPDDALT